MAQSFLTQVLSLPFYICQYSSFPLLQQIFYISRVRGTSPRYPKCYVSTYIKFFSHFVFPSKLRCHELCSIRTASSISVREKFGGPFSCPPFSPPYNCRIPPNPALSSSQLGPKRSAPGHRPSAHSPKISDFLDSCGLTLHYFYTGCWMQCSTIRHPLQYCSIG